MKAFISALLFASTQAANDWSATGTKVTAGDLSITPKVATSWSVSSSKMNVTWTTTGTLSKKLEKKDVAQAWWCGNFTK